MIDATVSRLAERAAIQAEVVARASRDLNRDGTRHRDWWAGDPLNCANCALMLEQAEQDCLTPGPRHTGACWEDKRCPDHVGSAP